eukprot:1274337-Pleurochrysis_carterae.AAC.1
MGGTACSRRRAHGPETRTSRARFRGGGSGSCELDCKRAVAHAAARTRHGILITTQLHKRKGYKARSAYESAVVRGRG